MARVNPLIFSKSWTSSTDFPTKEGSEEKVRSDFQYLFNEIRDYINGKLIDAVNTVMAADVQVSDAEGATSLRDRLVAIKAKLDDLQQQIVDATVGGIPDGSLTSDKLADRTIQGSKIDLLTIGHEHLKSNSVDTSELCDRAVTEDKLETYSVTTLKIAPGAVTPEKLTQELQTAIKEKYDVGDIFITTRDGNPSGLLGYGTWFQIADRFLLASGTRQVGDSGGEETHTLTIDEMPSHSHKVRYVGSRAGGVYGGQPGTSVDAEPNYNGLILAPEGGGLPHNNMPPYFVVNIWLRTA